MLSSHCVICSFCSSKSAAVVGPAECALPTPVDIHSVPAVPTCAVLAAPTVIAVSVVVALPAAIPHKLCVLGLFASYELVL